MRLALLLAGVVLMTGCRKAPASVFDEAALPPAVVTLATPPSTVTYDRKRVVGEIGLPTERIEQRWTRVTTDHLGIHYDVSVGSPGGAARVVRRHRHGADGVVLVAEGALDDAGTIVWEPWLPPARVLPADPVAHPTWSGSHTVGGVAVERSCEVTRPSEGCDGGGVVVVCEAAYPDFRLVTRDHYCEGIGWSGYESLVVRPTSPSVRTWTESLERSSTTN